MEQTIQRKKFSNNPANDPDYIWTLLEKMEEDPSVKEAVHELFYRGDISFLLHDTQKEMYDVFKNSSEQEILDLCCRQLGKSFGGLAIAIETARKNPGSVVRYFGPTIDQVNDIVNDNLSIIQQLAPPDFITRIKAEKRWKIGRPTDKRKSELRIAPLSEAHVDGKRGGNAILIVCEEGGFVKSDEYKNALLGVIWPQLLRSRGKLLHISTPSKDVAHYLHETVLVNCERKNTLSRYTIYDNPHLTDDQISKMKEKYRSDPDFWDREYLAKITRDPQRLITPEFSEEQHVKELKVPPYTYFLTSIDFGGVRDNHALLLTYYDFERNKVCVLDEVWMGINTGTDEIIKAGRKMEGSNDVIWLKGIPKRIIDAPDQLLIDVKRMQYECTKPQKGKDSVEDGIQALRVAFLKNQLEISPKCRILIQTLKYGMWDKHRKDFQRTDALGHCDMIAALSYAYRHIDRFNNPFPPNLGLNRETHYFETQKSRDNDAQIERAFDMDDD